MLLVQNIAYEIMCYYLRRWIDESRWKRERCGGHGRGCRGVHHGAGEELRERLALIAVAVEIGKQSHGTGAIPAAENTLHGGAWPESGSVTRRRRGWRCLLSSSLSFSAVNHSLRMKRRLLTFLFFFSLSFSVCLCFLETKLRL